MQQIHAVIKPNSTKGPLVLPGKTSNYIIYVKEPAIDGKANDAAVKAFFVKND